MKKVILFIACAIMCFIIQIIATGIVYAESVEQPKPEKLDVEKDLQGNYNIYYDRENDKHAAVLSWYQTEQTAAAITEDETSSGPIVERGYKVYISTNNSTFIENPTTVDWGSSVGEKITTVVDSYGRAALKSGTVYFVYVKAYHIHRLTTDTGVVETIHESFQSNTAAFLTMINVSVDTPDENSATGTDSYKVIWDDVKCYDSRIDYDLQFSTSKDFVMPREISLSRNYVSSTGPIIPVKGTGNRDMLSFVVDSQYGVKPGTIYYVKIKPKNFPITVRYRTESDIAVGFTQLVATMSKISDDWWRIDWEGVSTSSASNSGEIVYKILRGDASKPVSAPIQIAETTDRKYPVNVAGGNYYFIVVADVLDQYGQPLKGGMRSSKLYANEADAPVNPVMPEICDVVRTFYPDGEILFNYYSQENLKPNSVSVAILPPKLADGTIDTQVVYDIWIVDNPRDLDYQRTPKWRENYKIASDDGSEVITLSNGTVMAYKFNFKDLVQNSTYYLKIVAKKKFTVVESTITLKYFESFPALKIIVTPLEDHIDQPIVPARPPFRIKLDENKKTMIGTDDAYVEWDLDWYEYWDGVRWNWISKEVYDEKMAYLSEHPESVSSSVYGYIYRHVEYDAGVAFKIGWIEYFDGINYNNLKNYPCQVSYIAPNTKEYHITNLNSNKMYIVWLKAWRANTNPQIDASATSDPLVIVTKPKSEEYTVKPETPILTGTGGDTYIDLKWNFVADNKYSYYIKYSKVDDINSAEKTITVKYSDLQVTQIYRVSNLIPNTLYYFWIQADSSGKNDSKALSNWSDSLIVRTKPYEPPEIPTGFGIKNSDDAITQHSVIFQWIKKDGLQYIIEIDKEPEFKAKVRYNAGTVNEYKVENLVSNVKYYARLYAYDPVKQLESKPTNYIVFATLKGDEEYDSNVDKDIVLSGPFVTAELSEDSVYWYSLRPEMINKFIETVKTDGIVDYRIDVNKEYDKIGFRAKNKFFKVLSELKENLILNYDDFMLVLRPYIIDFEKYVPIAGDSEYDIVLKTSVIHKKNKDYSNNLKYFSDAVQLNLGIRSSVKEVDVETAKIPLGLVYFYKKTDNLEPEKTAVYCKEIGTNNGLKIQNTEIVFKPAMAKGEIRVNAYKSGEYAVMQGYPFSDNFPALSNITYEALKELMKKYQIQSIDLQNFKTEDRITVGETVKIVMDILGYNYGWDYMNVAEKAGLIADNRILEDGFIDGNILKNMLDRMSEILSKSSGFEENKAIYSKRNITKGDVIYEIYYKLKKIGAL